MSLQDDLDKLYRLRETEVRNLHRTYLHTKRTVSRAVSPQRIVRKRMGLFLGLGALLGVALAPAPLKVVPPSGDARPRRESRKSLFSHLPLGWIKRAVGSVAPAAAAFIPDTHPEEAQHQQTHQAAAPASAPHPPQQKKMLHMLITEALTLILSRIDLPSILQHVVHAAQSGGGQPADQAEGTPYAENESSHESPATVAVADVGTVTGQNPMGNL